MVVVVRGVERAVGKVVARVKGVRLLLVAVTLEEGLKGGGAGRAAGFPRSSKA